MDQLLVQFEYQIAAVNTVRSPHSDRSDYCSWRKHLALERKRIPQPKTQSLIPR